MGRSVWRFCVAAFREQIVHVHESPTNLHPRYTSRMTDPLLRWRSEFPILENTIYLVSNSLGAMPRGVQAELQAYADLWAARGVRAWNEGWWDSPISVGDEVGKVIGAAPGSVSMHTNVTTAAAIALSTFKFTPQRGARSRSKIVMTDMDFHSTLYVHQGLVDWLHDAGSAVHIERVASDDGITIDLDKLLSAIDEHTALVAISHVLFKSAFVQDVAAIIARAHAVGAQVALDVFHSAGIVPLNVSELDVDFVYGGVLKWLCGGPGGAFLYVNPRIAPHIEPKLTGWMAHAHPFAFEAEMDYAPDGFRFLLGTPQVACLYAAQPGLAIINEVGIPAIRAKSLHQVGLLMELAAERGYKVTTPAQPEQRGGTIALDLGEVTQAVSLELKRREILIDYRPGAGIRISPHFYTRDEECAHAIREIDDILSTQAYERYLSEKPTVT